MLRLLHKIIELIKSLLLVDTIQHRLPLVVLDVEAQVFLFSASYGLLSRSCIVVLYFVCDHTGAAVDRYRCTRALRVQLRLVWWRPLDSIFDLAENLHEGLFEDATDEEALEESIV